MSVTNIHLLRHGEVEASGHRIFGGSRIDHSLSPLGMEQAEKLAVALRHLPLDAVYCSPLVRARLTMAPILAGRQLDPVIDEDLREIDFGLWSGLKWEQVIEKMGCSAFDWLDQLNDPGFPEGESGPQVMARVGASLQRILARHAGHSVAIVCHGGVIRVALALLLDLPLPKMAAFEIDYASHTWLTLGERPDWRASHKLELLNFTPWRDLASG